MYAVSSFIGYKVFDMSDFDLDLDNGIYGSYSFPTSADGKRVEIEVTRNTIDHRIICQIRLVQGHTVIQRLGIHAFLITKNSVQRFVDKVIKKSNIQPMV